MANSGIGADTEGPLARDATPVTLDTSLKDALGARTAGVLARAFKLDTVGELLMHYPRRYAMRGELSALTSLTIGEHATILAEVRTVSERAMRNRRGGILEVAISDGNGIATLTFFNQSWRAKELVAGRRGVFSGKVTRYRGTLQLAHPDYELFEEESSSDPDAAERWANTPIPLYPATASFSSWKIQKAIHSVLDRLGPLGDPLPPEVVSSEKILALREAYEKVHRPQTAEEWPKARASLRFREAFVLQLALLQRRERLRAQQTRPRSIGNSDLLTRFDAALPFELTPEQREASDVIFHELASPVPMNRLLQGEVGSGKTVVALRAMIAATATGGQAALLAPTEVLANQHLRSIVSLLGPELAPILAPTLLTGSMSVPERRRALLSIVSGNSRIVVGTHALISEVVTFFDLGFVVIDEQHRFGVDQRQALRDKAATPPHTLVLTATPIPRTIAMSVFGDLDISTIKTLPAGRQPIETFVVPLAEKPGWAKRIWERLAEELAAGRQAFVVCPTIDTDAVEDDTASQELLPEDPVDDAEEPRQLASVAQMLAALAEIPELANAKIAGLHGKLPAEEKDTIMADFAAGRVDVLVATTVIEVGVNVPNASMMVVLDADRFGISQLHQLRGRVGRGEHAGLCLLVTAADELSNARERLDAVAATLDGFELADADLALRQEGDVLGASQSGGHSSLRLLRAARHGDVIEQARLAAQKLLAIDPTLQQHPALASMLEAALDERSIHYLGNA